MRWIRPTRRGVAAVAIAAVAVGMGTTFGPRSLDAVVLPVVVAFVAAGVQLVVLDAPQVTRRVPPAGDPGTTGTVSLTLTADTPATATVRDRLPSGLDGDPRGTVLVGGDPLTYSVTYRERGVHELGPAVVHARDVLGLARRTFVTEGRGSVLVYPRVYHPSTPVAERLRALSTPAAAAERGAFDHLREYTRSDSLRDVHWKSSAKRDDLVVQEFVDEGDSPTVTVVASAESGHADRMAEAAATVGYTLLVEGATVVLATPAGTVTLAPGETDRLLAHLARVGAGHVTDRDADVVVRAAADGATVRIDGEARSFDPGRRRSVGASADSEGERDAGTDADGRTLSATDAPEVVT
jgi:uncharacterized protein (DUF58 family)